MQFWIFFQAGVGGDGFANLLEHAENVEPADGDLTWRIHKIIQNKIKFYGVPWTNDPIPFRSFTENKNLIINSNYIILVQSEKNTIIPTHYEYFDKIINSSLRSTVEKNQIKINLYDKDYERVALDCLIKNELTIDLKKLTQIIKNVTETFLESDEFHIHIDYKKCINDWYYLNSTLKKIGINLHKKYYDEFLNIINN